MRRVDGLCGSWFCYFYDLKCKGAIFGFFAYSYTPFGRLMVRRMSTHSKQI